jgi:hypothetical protein
VPADQSAHRAHRCLYVDNLFDEVAIGRVLSSPFGFDLTLSSPQRTIGVALGMQW